MAILNAVVLASKTIKGGKNKVRISVAHNGETRYIVTDIILDSNKEFKNGVVVKRADAAILNTKIRNLLQRYQSAINELEYINGFSCPELVFHILNLGASKHRTLKSIYEEYVETARIKQSTVMCYKIFWANITRFNFDNMLVEHITYSTILSYEKKLRDRKLKPTTIRYNLIFFKALINYAIRCGYVQFRVNPFNGYTLPKPEVRQAWLSVDEIKRIRDLECSNEYVAKCRDLFMLSYYLGGINMIDLLKINFNKHHDIIRYERTKTERCSKSNKYVEFAIPEEAKELIDRLKGSDGLLDVRKHQRWDSCRGFFNCYMRHLGEEAGIERLIFYSARKSFSQHAFLLGIRESIIDYILGHKVDKNNTSLYHYIWVTPDMATDAVRQVLNNLK